MICVLLCNPCVFYDIFIMKAPYPIFACLFTHHLSFISSHLCHQTGACAGLDVPCPDKNLYIYILFFHYLHGLAAAGTCIFVTGVVFLRIKVLCS